MMKREGGFTLIELMITMIMFIIVIASVSSIFLGLVNQFKQQSKIAETNLEGLTGLEILRQDLDNAGYGLPWELSGASYNEAVNDTATVHDDSLYNDSTTNPPRAIVSGNGDGIGNSDVLVIKAINIARNDASQKWTTQKLDPLTLNETKRIWGMASEDLNGTDTVIVIFPGSTDINSRSLVVSGGNFATTFNNTAGFAPSVATDTNIIYGMDTAAIRMPFNRADYFISNTNVPARCAAGTGVLVKAVVRHNDGGFDFMPLLDCVADFQVIFGTNTVGYTDNLSTLTDTNGNGIIDAQEIREQVTEVRVYILAHEGQRDTNYTYPNLTITIPTDPSDPGSGLGSTFNLSTSIGTGWQNFRWKVYTIVVNPNNLG
jgi:type II secretory pathway pseudopilin PulG